MQEIVLPYDLPEWDDLTVGPVGTREGSRFIARHHYAGGGGGNATCVGLYRGVELVGVAAFASPVSGDAAASVFGPDHYDRVMDLQRFVLVEEAPKNTESWFLVRALREYKRRRPETWAVTSFADATQGHLGTIYQATNAIYSGQGAATTQYIDQSGALRSNRSTKVSGHGNFPGLTRAQGAALGWIATRRLGKHRYLFLTPDDRAHRRELLRLVRWESQPYPKRTADIAEEAS
jgi:hypothetical protein